MPACTLIPGKDARLDQTIGSCQERLLAMGLETRITSWRHPAPHCWSVHLFSPEFPQLLSNGKGISRQAALASALGEFFERLATNFYFSDFFLDEEHDQPFLYFPEERWFASKTSKAGREKNNVGLLNRRLWQFYQSQGTLTVDLLADHGAALSRPGIPALPFRDLASGKDVYFPVSLLNNLYVSNGMAAGNSSTEAGAQALAEILERHAKSQIIAQGISLPDIPSSHLDRYPGIVATLNRLAAAGFAVRLKDASLGGRFPVICALLTDRDSGGVFAAFGASLRFVVAIERTLSELLQGRQLASLNIFAEPEHDLAAVADPGNLESHFIDSDGLLAWSMFRDRSDYPFTPWDFSGTSEQEFTRLLAIFQGIGARVFRAEYRHCGMYACRMLVPGISEIYPLEDLLYNNRIKGAWLRSHLLRLPALDRAGIARLLDELDDMGLSDRQLLGEAIGVLFDGDSAWETLRLGELKAMLHLAAGDHQEALGWCRWVIDHAALPDARRRHYRLLQALLGFRLAGETAGDYRAALSLRHGEEEIHQAEAVVAGRLRFAGLGFGDTWSRISTRHRQLLGLYRRLNRWKVAGLDERRHLPRTTL